MLFNSLNFAVFLPIVFVLYWFVTQRSLKLQNLLLFAASYFFYACWDWRFLFLLFFSTLLDFFSGLVMSRSGNKNYRKFWFWLSITANLGFLGIFKYYNFFAVSFAAMSESFGLHVNPTLLSVILPVGISFYTFHGLSYVIDIYKNRIQAEKNLIDYAVFVSFFPLLVAGPIERATHLLPQIKRKREFNYEKMVDGLRQILWGLFKKIAIADSCAVVANTIFNHSEDYSGSTLAFGALMFACQIYGDFSGYSDIALGTAKLFGIDLLKNFSFPYFSRNIAEFWRRWHISLSSWFRDYLYIPLGGSKVVLWKKIRNVLVIFLVSGFWHGANWTFIIWGLLNAVYIMPSVIFKTHRNNLDVVAQGRIFPNFKEVLQITVTFALTIFAWIFFRAADLSHALSFISGMFSETLFETPDFDAIGFDDYAALLLWFFFVFEWIGRENDYAMARFNARYFLPVRWVIYYFLVFAIITATISHRGHEQLFIYFQF